jgi:hypothetical protein
MDRLLFAMVLALFLGTASAWAEDKTPVKFKSTGEADQTLSTGYSPSDPLGSRPVNKEWDAGHPATRQPYDENCTEDRCVRAEQRQLGTTTWQEDRASGLHVSPKQGSPESAPSP